MSDDDKKDGLPPSMKKSLGLVVDNDPRSKPIRSAMDDLQNLTKALQTPGVYEIDGGEEDDEPLLEEAELVIVSKPSVVPDYQESDVSEDYRYSRQMIYTLLNEGGTALASALRLAKQSQHPRAFEIVNNMTNTMRDLTKDLMVLQKVYSDVTAGKESQKVNRKADGNQEEQAAPEHESKLQGTTSDIMRLVRQAQSVTDEQKVSN